MGLGSNSPWLQGLRESLEKIGSTPWDHTCPGLTMAAQESWKNTGMLAGVTDWRRSQTWGCKGRLVLGFKPRHGSHRREDHMALVGVGAMQLGQELGPHSFGVLPFATWLRQQDFA